MKRLVMALSFLLAVPVLAAENDPAARLHAARVSFLASLPAPLPPDPWSLRDPAAGSAKPATLEAYDRAILETRDWAKQANSTDLVPRKGLWVRPYRRDAGALDLLEVMDNAQGIGITDLFVETFWGGRLTYSGNPTFASRYPEDLLAAYVKEGRRRSIRVHAWIHTLDFGGDWAKAHPDTLVKDGFGGLSSSTEKGSSIVSPALAEVRMEISRLVDEATAHGADGVTLDYLRYPTRLRGDDIDETPDPRNFFGYNDRQLNGILDRHPEMATREFRLFLETGALAREEQREDSLARWKSALSEDLEGLIASAKTRINDEVLFGAAYFPDYYFHRHDSRVQESRHWADQFDVLSPMCYQYFLDEYPALYGTYTIHRALEIANDTVAHLAGGRTPLLIPTFSAEVPGTPLEAQMHHRTLREQTAFLKGRVFDRAFPHVRGIAYFSYGWIFRDSEARRKAGG